MIDAEEFLRAKICCGNNGHAGHVQTTNNFTTENINRVSVQVPATCYSCGGRDILSQNAFIIILTAVTTRTSSITGSTSHVLVPHQ